MNFKKDRRTLIQIVLLLTGIILIALTYFIYPQKKTKNIEKVEETIKLEQTLNEEASESTFENVSYKGFDAKGNPFEIGSRYADIKKDEPDLTFMTDVTAYFYTKDGKTVVITSKTAIYNKVTNDMFFKTNVKMVESDNTLYSDYLDVVGKENTVKAYDNVKFYNNEGYGFADQVEVDINTKTSKISMYDDTQIIMKVKTE